MPRWATPLIAATRSVRSEGEPIAIVSLGLFDDGSIHCPTYGSDWERYPPRNHEPEGDSAERGRCRTHGSVLDRPSAAATVKMSVTAIRLPIYVPSVPSRPATGPKNGMSDGRSRQTAIPVTSAVGTTTGTASPANANHTRPSFDDNKPTVSPPIAAAANRNDAASAALAAA